jgi:hypothetical protein
MPSERLTALTSARIAVLLAALLLLGYTSARAYQLSFTYDESWTLFIADGSVADVLTYEHPSGNSHLLNTVLLKAARRALGAHEFIYRLPNLLAHALYLMVSVFWVYGSRRPLLVLWGFVLLNLNPFMLDFFSLARGYGLALAFTLTSLACLRQYVRHPTAVRALGAFLCGSLAAISNFAFLYYSAALLVVFVLITIRRAWRAEDGLMKTARRVLVANRESFTVSAVLLLAVAPLLLRLKEAKQLYYGGLDSFWTDTVFSLAKASLYGQPYAPWLAPVLTIMVAVAVAAGAVTCFGAIKSGGHGSVENPVCVYLLLLVILALGTTIQHHVLGTRFLMERTALLFVPLFAITLLSGWETWMARRRLSRPLSVATAVLILLIGAHGLKAANLAWTHTWKFDADVKDVVTLLEDEYRRNSGARDEMRLMVSWPLKMAVRFYRRERNLSWLKEIIFDPAEDSQHYDFFYLLGGRHEFGYEMDEEYFQARKDQVVRFFPNSNTYLLRGEWLDGENARPAVTDSGPTS